MIKNLLFDLGGVIIDIDRNRCVEALEKLGVADADRLLGKYVQSGIFADLESGNISAAEFRDALRRHAGNTALTDSDIDTAFQKFLSDFRSIASKSCAFSAGSSASIC